MDIDEIEDDNEWIAEEEVHRGGQSQLEIMNVLLGTKGALSSEGVRHRRIRRAPSSSLHFNEPPVAARHSSPDPAQIRSPRHPLGVANCVANGVILGGLPWTPAEIISP